MRAPEPDCWLHPDVEMRPSDVAGRGLFAAHDLPRGTTVARPHATLDVGNHGCDPNLGWSDEHTLVTMRDIAAGEELLHDYATSTADPDFYLRCHCPSARCRQMIEGTDWRIPQLQRRYAGYWTPYLQRLIDGWDVVREEAES